MQAWWARIARDCVCHVGRVPAERRLHTQTPLSLPTSLGARGAGARRFHDATPRARSEASGRGWSAAQGVAHLVDEAAEHGGGGLDPLQRADPLPARDP